MKINESIICAGYGGQGVMVLGKFLANAAMTQGLNVTWLPAYGIEVRGGTAYSSVRISSGNIGSPVVERPSSAIIMNSPSLDRFENDMAKGSLMILNISMAEREPKRKDIEIVRAPLTEMALKIGNVKVANVIAAGVYAARRGFLKRETFVRVVDEMVGGNGPLVELNIKALECGINFK